MFVEDVIQLSFPKPNKKVHEGANGFIPILPQFRKAIFWIPEDPPALAVHSHLKGRKFSPAESLAGPPMVYDHTHPCIQTHNPPSCLLVHLFSTARPGSEPRVRSGLFLNQKQYVAVQPPLTQRVQSPCWSAHTERFSCSGLSTHHRWVC